MLTPRLVTLACASVCLAAFAPARTEIPNAAQPQLAAASDGRVWLVYGRLTETPPAAAPAAAAPAADHAHHGAAPGAPAKKGHQPPTKTGTLFVASSSDGGATFSSATSVATLPKIMLGMRRGPRIAAHGDRVTVTVIAHELLAFTSTDAGKTWSEPVTINSVPTCAREGLHDLAAAPDGRLFVTWLDLRNGTMELWGASSTDGGRTWSANEQVYKSPDKSICECCHPSALFDAEGNLAVMWRNSIEGSRDLWMTTRPNSAAQFSPARKLGEGTWKLSACPMDGGEIVALGRGEFGAVWQRNGEVFFTRPGTSEIALGKGKQPVALHSPASAPVIVWQQGTGLVLSGGGSPSPTASSVHALDARFPALVSVPKSNRPVLAYEQGPAKGPTHVIVEQL